MHTNLVGLKSRLLCAKFQGRLTYGSGEEDLSRDFYYIWAWQPSWPRDEGQLYKLLSPP